MVIDSGTKASSDGPAEKKRESKKRRWDDKGSAEAKPTKPTGSPVISNGGVAPPYKRRSKQSGGGLYRKLITSCSMIV